MKSACPMTCQQNAATSTRLPSSASGISASSTSRSASSRAARAARSARAARVGRVHDQHLAHARGRARSPTAIEDAAADGDVVAGVAGDRRSVVVLAHACSVGRSCQRCARRDLGDDRASQRPCGACRVRRRRRPRRRARGARRRSRCQRATAVRASSGRLPSPSRPATAAAIDGQQHDAVRREVGAGARRRAPLRRRATTTPPPARAVDDRGALERAEVRLAVRGRRCAGIGPCSADDQRVGVDERRRRARARRACRCCVLPAPIGPISTSAARIGRGHAHARRRIAGGAVRSVSGIAAR